MKKIFVITLASVMLIGLATPAFAKKHHRHHKKHHHATSTSAPVAPPAQQ